MIVIPDLLWFVFDVIMIFIGLLTLYAIATDRWALRTYDSDPLLLCAIAIYFMLRIAMI